MDGRQFVELCNAVDAGEERFVENLARHEEGRVMACDRRRIEVEVAGRKKSWQMEICEEKQPSEAGFST